MGAAHAAAPGVQWPIDHAKSFVAAHRKTTLDLPFPQKTKDGGECALVSRKNPSLNDMAILKDTQRTQFGILSAKPLSNVPNVESIQLQVFFFPFHEPHFNACL